MNIFNTHSAEETTELAINLAKKLFKSGGIVALYGDLGAGKTTFTQGFARGLGINDKIISPTFVLSKQYSIPNSEKSLFHLDLYRLENLTELESIGLKEILTNNEHLILIEWAEKAEALLPKQIIKIKIEKGESDSRKITVTPEIL